MVLVWINKMLDLGTHDLGVLPITRYLALGTRNQHKLLASSIQVVMFG